MLARLHLVLHSSSDTLHALDQKPCGVSNRMEQTALAATLEMKDQVGVITMRHAPHNLLGGALTEAILSCLEQARGNSARALLLRSGLRHFSAGADPAVLSSAASSGTRMLSVSPTQFLAQFEACPLPIVAAVHGVCVGGGFELALACDFILAARSAKIGSVEVTIGINPLMGGIQRQAQRAGALRAKEMSMLGHRYDAETLERWNLINRVVDDDKLDDAAMAVTQELAHGPTLAHGITKQLTAIAVNQGVSAADAAMEELQKPMWTSEDVKIGMASLMTNGPGLAKFVGR